MTEASTLIIGAGVAGSALAMHLALLGDQEVLVVDPDLAGTLSSSERNAGGVRATWWRKVNIELCALSIDYFREHASDLGFRESGYLWLYGPELWQGAQEHILLQNACGREVELVSPSDINARWPFLDRLDGVAGATFSPQDGLINPNAVKEHYRARARACGVRFLDRHVFVGVDSTGDAVTAARLRSVRDEHEVEQVLTGAASPAGEESTIRCQRIVNAAGPWAPLVAAACASPVPCRAVPRQIALIACRDVDLSSHGMIVDTTGCYFHHEGGNVLIAGYSPPNDPSEYNFTSGGRNFFDREIWPRLADRSASMERLDYVRGWAGLYELSPDCSALLGRVHGLRNVYELHSFSGRGIMQSYGAALALAELILKGRFETIDASPLAGTRFATGELEFEDLHI